MLCCKDCVVGVRTVGCVAGVRDKEGAVQNTCTQTLFVSNVDEDGDCVLQIHIRTVCF